MPSTIVTICHGSNEIETKERMLFTLPTGGVGAAHQGLVYPLIDKHKIDIAGPHFYVQDCPRLLDLPTPWAPKATPETPVKWSLDTSGHYNYLLMTGNEDLYRNARIGLENIGLKVTKQGPRADAGDDFTWFLRLGLTESQSLSSATVEEALGRLVKGVDQLDGDKPSLTLTSVSETDLLRKKITETEGNLLKAEKTNLRNEEEIVHLKKQFEEQKQQAHRAKRLSEDQEKFFQAARQEFKDQLKHMVLPDTEQKNLIEKLSVEVSDLGRRNVILTHRAAQLSDNIQSSEKTIQDAEKRVQTKYEQVQHFQALYEEAESEIEKYKLMGTGSLTANKMEPGGRRKQTKTLRNIVEALLPHLHFIGNSLDFMAIELRDLRNLCQKLGQLEQSNLQGKRVKNTLDWLEVHFNTGSGRDGRLYFRKVKNNPKKKYEVLASDKHDQPRDIRRLSTHVPLVNNN